MQQNIDFFYTFIPTLEEAKVQAVEALKSPDMLMDALTGEDGNPERVADFLQSIGWEETPAYDLANDLAENTELSEEQVNASFYAAVQPFLENEKQRAAGIRCLSEILADANQEHESEYLEDCFAELPDPAPSIDSPFVCWENKQTWRKEGTEAFASSNGQTLWAPFLLQAEKQGMDNVEIRHEEGKPYFVISLKDEEKSAGHSFTVIPEEWVKKAYAHKDCHDMLSRAALQHDTIYQFLSNAGTFPAMEKDPVAFGAVNGIAESMIWNVRHQLNVERKHPTDMDEFMLADWNGNPKFEHTATTLGQKLQNLTKDIFQKWDSTHVTDPQLPIAAQATARNAAWYTPQLLGALPKTAETDLSRGIAKALLSQDFDKMHAALDPFIACDRKAAKALEKTGREPVR